MHEQQMLLGPTSFSSDPARTVLLIGYRFVFLLAQEALTFSSPVQEALSNL